MTLRFSLPDARRSLQLAARAWFTAATFGQWLFVLFILAFYGGHGLVGDPTALNAKPHITGYVAGDGLGNTQYIGHALLGGLITFAGTWQLIPTLRRRWPHVHRWLGRLFVIGAGLATLTGLFLTWIRGSQLGPASNLSITLNGLLILVFATLAWRSALRRDIATHRHHALRLWLLVNGVWFLRIGILLAGLVLAPLGIEINYSGVAFISVSFASWLLPLGVLELYLHAERATATAPRYIVATLLVLLAMATFVGSVAAAVWMWWPYVQP